MKWSKICNSKKFATLYDYWAAFSKLKKSTFWKQNNTNALNRPSDTSRLCLVWKTINFLWWYTYFIKKLNTKNYIFNLSTVLLLWNCPSDYLYNFVPWKTLFYDWDPKGGWETLCQLLNIPRFLWKNKVITVLLYNQLYDY